MSDGGPRSSRCDRSWFTIGGAWADRERNQFVWLISYDGPETFAERNALYWSSPARERMNLDPEDYLLHTEEHTVEDLLPRQE